MPRIFIKGLVKLANAVQRELSQPLSESRRRELEQAVSLALCEVTEVLRSRGCNVRSLPPPSRRAFQFLAGLDLAHWPTVPHGASAPAPKQVRLSGITAAVESIAEALAAPRPSHDRSHETLLQRIRSSLDRAESARGDLGPEQLTHRSRQHLAWLRFLSDRDAFQSYTDAVESAAAAFHHTAPSHPWVRPLRVHFRPVESAYRVRVRRGVTRVLMPTPMIALEDESFIVLGRVMFDREVRDSGALHEMLMNEGYQQIQSELEDLAGTVEESRGMVHDLAESYARVNRRYFAEAMERPRLTWNRVITTGKFGHYNFSSDTVMISRTLDQPAVPAYVVDHVMYHELLHKKHGLRWHRGRGHAHTPHFRRDERLFEQFEQAEQFLNRLASGKMPGVGDAL